MNIRTSLLLISTSFFAFAGISGEWISENERLRMPEIREAVNYAEYHQEGLKSLLLEAQPAEDGTKTFVFAYFALPSGPVPPKGFPAVVLQHGNTDTCFPKIAQRWVQRGYAVISYDHYGNLPKTNCSYQQRPVLEESLQKKLNVKFAIENPKLRKIWAKNIWSSASHALTYLRSRKEINPDQIFLIGVSHGAVNGLITAALDSRFAGYICCYGCGFFSDPMASGSYTRRFDPENDPARLLPQIKIPVFWIVGTNDFAFGQRNWQKSIAHTPATENQASIPGLGHGANGAHYDICYRWIDSQCGKDSPLPKLGTNRRIRNRVSCPILRKGDGIRQASLCYTTDKEITPQTRWQSIAATILENELQAELPPETTAFFFNAEDRIYPISGSMPVSSPLSVLLP